MVPQRYVGTLQCRHDGKEGVTNTFFSQIRMNVTEGLPCGFVQQAVAIDTEESTYIPLGNVKKTVVVTPNVEGAFSSQQRIIIN